MATGAGVFVDSVTFGVPVAVTPPVQARSRRPPPRTADRGDTAAGDTAAGDTAAGDTAAGRGGPTCSRGACA